MEVMVSLALVGILATVLLATAQIQVGVHRDQVHRRALGRELRQLAVDHAHPGATLRAALDLLHPRLVDRQPESRTLLAVDLGEVAAVM